MQRRGSQPRIPLNSIDSLRDMQDVCGNPSSSLVNGVIQNIPPFCSTSDDTSGRHTHEPFPRVAGSFVSKTLYSPGRPGTRHWHTDRPSLSHAQASRSEHLPILYQLAGKNPTSMNTSTYQTPQPDHRPLPLALSLTHRHLRGDPSQCGKSSRHEARSAPAARAETK